MNTERIDRVLWALLVAGLLLSAAGWGWAFLAWIGFL